MNPDPTYLSFPPGSISDGPLRVPILWNGEAGIALDKPEGLAAFQDTRVGGGSRSILATINNRAAAEGSQFERLGIQKLFSVNLLDRDVSGVLLYAKTEEARAELKNAMGSSQFSFRYHFLTAAECGEEALSCELPVAVHCQKPVALVSHKTGKKTVTTFRRLQSFGACSLWEAESVYDRFHQIRLHAVEVGLPILGDPLYQGSRRAPASDFAAAAQAAKLPHYEGACLHLAALLFPVGEASIEVEAPMSHGLQLFLKKLAGPTA